MVEVRNQNKFVGTLLSHRFKFCPQQAGVAYVVDEDRSHSSCSDPPVCETGQLIQVLGEE